MGLRLDRGPVSVRCSSRQGVRLDEFRQVGPEVTVLVLSDPCRRNRIFVFPVPSPPDKHLSVTCHHPYSLTPGVRVVL